MDGIEDDEMEIIEEEVVEQEATGNEPDEDEEFIVNKDDEEIPDLMAERGTRSGLRTNRKPVNSHRNTFVREFSCTNVGDIKQWNKSKT